MEIIEIANRNEGKEFRLKYQDVNEELLRAKFETVSKAQFFKSVRKFENIGLLSKVGSSRSFHYIMKK